VLRPSVRVVACCRFQGHKGTFHNLSQTFTLECLWGSKGIQQPGDSSVNMQAIQPSRASPLVSLGRTIPPVLRPAVRAYILGYASSTVPRLLSLLLIHLSRKRKTINKQSQIRLLPSITLILQKGLEFQRFPAFCAALIGGSTLLEARDRNPLEECP
jgi:hypothetical protein